MKRKHFHFICFAAVGAFALGGLAVGLAAKNQTQIVKAGDAPEYTLTINRANAVDYIAGHYTVTAMGNNIYWYPSNCDYDPESSHLVLMRSNGSGFYLQDPIQSIISITVTYDAVGSMNMFFGYSEGDIEGGCVSFTSGVPFSAPVGFDTNVYLSMVGNLSTYVDSIVIMYACK